MKKNNFFRKIDMSIVNMIAAIGFLILAVVSIVTKKSISITLLVIWTVLFVAINIVAAVFRKKENMAMIENLNFYVGDDGDGNRNNFIKTYMQPLFFIDKKGTYIWANDLFRDIFPTTFEMKKAITQIYKTKIKNRFELKEELISTDIKLGDGYYRMMCNVISQFKDTSDGAYFMVYFTETTDFEELKQKYADERVAIGEIKIDTYEEIFFNDGESVGNQAMAELATKFDEWLEGKSALLKRLSSDRFLFIVEDKFLRELEDDGFSILKTAKMINVQNTVPVTLSMGISAYNESIAKDYEVAEAALELALARGGDQVVIRTNGKDTYYGGSNVDVASKNTVKSRVAAEKLKQEILKSNRVVIMGHSVPDMDSIGSALAVYRACCICGVPANIVLNESNKSIEEAYRNLISLPEYADVFVDNTEILSRVDDRCLIVVVDTYTQKMTECPKLLDLSNRVVVIDHHRKGADYIKNTVMDYSETYASSTSELMTEILRFLDPDIRIPIAEAEALYAGILVDTKNFVFKTGVKTFNAAGFLREMGVDFVNVKKYFLPDYETFSSVSKVTANAQVVLQKVAVSVTDLSIKDGKFVSALAADKLLEISGIGASFVLCETPGGVNISGRSLGEINVQVILEKMGGGGHLTSAGAFVKDSSVESVKMTLIRNIEDYFKV